MQTGKDKEIILNEFVSNLDQDQIVEILKHGMNFAFSPDILVYVKKQNMVQGYLALGNKQYPFQITFHYNTKDDQYVIITEIGKIFSIRKVKEVEEI